MCGLEVTSRKTFIEDLTLSYIHCDSQSVSLGKEVESEQGRKRAVDSRPKRRFFQGQGSSLY